jgi:hypothetical protein
MREAIETKNRQLLRAFLLLLSVCCLMWAQTETGQITGTVTDATGAVIPNATVRVTSAGTGAERNTTSSSSGDFSITNLLPGAYTVSVDASGFTTFKQTVTVAVGGRTGLPVKLEIGQTGTTVQVSEAAAQVNTETQTLSTNVSQNQLRELPTLTRDPYSLVAVSGNVSNATPGLRGVKFSINRSFLRF